MAYRNRSAKPAFTEASAFPGTALNDVQKVQIEEALKPIDQTPDSKTAVGGFGAATMERNAKIAKDIGNMLGAVVNGEMSREEGIRTAKNLSEAHAEIPPALGLLVAGAREVLRRYDKEYIPEAREQYGNSQYLFDLIQRRREFAERAVELAALHSASGEMAKVLKKYAGEDSAPKPLDVPKL